VTGQTGVPESTERKRRGENFVGKKNGHSNATQSWTEVSHAHNEWAGKEKDYRQIRCRSKRGQTRNEADLVHRNPVCLP